MLQQPMIVRWEGPLPSPGSTQAAPRVLFHGHIVQDTIPAMVRLAVQETKRAIQAEGIVIGSSLLYSDGSAMIADLTDPEVAALLENETKEALFISPRLLLLNPATNQGAGRLC